MQVIRCEVEETPPPSPPITPPLTPTAPPENISHGCHVCEGHIHDWLSLPLVPEEEFAKKIRPKALKRAAGEIAGILYRLITKYSEFKSIVESSYCMMLLSEASKYNPNWIEDRKIPTEQYAAFKATERKLLPETLMRFETSSDTAALRALVEDKSCLKRGVDVDEWLGFWLLIMWDFIPALHLEHQGLKPATGGGPAPGLRSHTPPPRPPPVPQLQLPPITNIPSVPSSPSDPSVQVRFEMDELYS